MSVVVKRLKSNSMEVYVKGAPEVMVDICEKDSCTNRDFLTYCTHLKFFQSPMITMTFYRTTRNVDIELLQWLVKV